ncbi:MAG: hypothetical protein M1832_003891 [Thelocarpon impressellum]|nr:MAG: hypothetical protein M1832_003891 [Thelocarpon impressellum]
MDLSHLLSPPETTAHDSFSQRCSSSPFGPSQLRSGRRVSDGAHPPMSSADISMDGKLPSPPVTPATRTLQVDGHTGEDAEPDSPMRDPPLFPPNDAATTALALSQPLFPTVARDQTAAPAAAAARVDPALDAIVSQHMAMHMSRYRQSVTRPTRDEYLLAVSCVPIVSKKYAENPRRWLQQERRILDERFGGANRVWKRPSAKGLAKLAPAPPAGATKKHPAGPTTAAATARSRGPRAPRAPRPPKRTPKSKALDSFDAAGLVVAASPKRVIGTSREDTDFASLPDFSPPPSTLPKGNTKALKADWKGQVLDLSRDPHRHLLHEAEVNLAATLRLSCATYLCSKRRIFVARLDALRIGKEFRKTDSQQACKIDVNKASKLWAAYDKVGWFKPEHFTEHF